MSTLKVNKIEHTGTTNGGIEIDSDGHVQVDSVQMPSAGPLSNRNLIINGAMNISERATTGSFASGGYKTVDRWRYTQGGGYGTPVNPTLSQSTDVPNNTFRNSFKYETGTGTAPAADQYIEFTQFLEGQQVTQLAFGAADAKTITLSFWVKASIAGTYCVTFGSGAPWASNRKRVAEYSISATNTWEFITITVPGDTGGTWDRTTNNTGLIVNFVVGSGSDKQGTKDTWLDASTVTNTSNQTNLAATTGATWFITGVQLEVGDVATPFEHLSPGKDLERCRRYYWKGVVRGSASQAYGYRINMRTTPASSTTTGSGSIVLTSKDVFLVGSSAAQDVTVTLSSEIEP